MEFLGGELLYAMRVVSHGRFNLCPAPVCNPDDGEAAACEVSPSETVHAAPTLPVEFFPYPEVPAQAEPDVGGIEYLESADGRLVFYDINATSNLRPSIAQAFGFDPFERVVDYLVREIRRAAGPVPRTAAL